MEIESVRPPTREDHRQHLMEGADKCLVCGASPLYGNWTDYNGQIRCIQCGMTYQILGSHLSEEALAEFGLEKNQIAKRYCDAFEIHPLCKAYWDETQTRLPLGAFMGSSPISKDEYLSFSTWLSANIDTLQPLYAHDFRWDVLRATATV